MHWLGHNLLCSQSLIAILQQQKGFLGYNLSFEIKYILQIPQHTLKLADKSIRLGLTLSHSQLCS